MVQGNGIREIAYDGIPRIKWLERSEREKEEDVSSLIQNMHIESDDIIADIGAKSSLPCF